MVFLLLLLLAANGAFCTRLLCLYRRRCRLCLCLCLCVYLCLYPVLVFVLLLLLLQNQVLSWVSSPATGNECQPELLSLRSAQDVRSTMLVFARIWSMAEVICLGCLQGYPAQNFLFGLIFCSWFSFWRRGHRDKK